MIQRPPPEQSLFLMRPQMSLEFCLQFSGLLSHCQVCSLWDEVKLPALPL